MVYFRRVDAGWWDDQATGTLLVIAGACYLVSQKVVKEQRWSLL
jgi:hypothetical protein